MIGKYIFTQYDQHKTKTKADTIGLGAYNIDTHNSQRIPQNGWTYNDGDVEQPMPGTSFYYSYELPYGYCLL
jgi:FAD dependent oxidoreductase